MGVGFDSIGIEVEFSVQAGVHGGQVIALEVIVDVGLPVAIHVVSAAFEELHVLEGESLGLLRKLSEALGQRPRLRIKIHKHEVEPFRTADGGEREVLGAESIDPVDLGGVVEGAVEVVGPSVIEAAKKLARSAAFGRRSSAMAADVKESTQHVISAANGEQGFPD